MSNGPFVSTPRLLLRPVEEQDADATSELITPDIARQLSTWPSPMGHAEALDRIRRSQDLLAKREAVDFAILKKPDLALLGWAGLWLVSRDVARIGYWIATSCRGQGVTSEALAHAIPAACGLLGFSIIEALVLPDNGASTGLLAKLGFVEGGEMDEFIVSQGISRSCTRYLLDLQPTKPTS